MSRRLVIVGAGGFGREVHSWVKSSPKFIARESIGSVVFIDDVADPATVPAPIIGGIEAYIPAEDDVLICAIGSPEYRRSVVERLSSRGAKFVEFIHDSVVFGEKVRTQPGLVLCPNVVITTDVDLGEHVHINTGSTIGHDVVIGDFVTLSSACNLAGRVTIEDDAFLGTAVTIIPGKTVGRGALVGAGSVVLKNVAPGITSFGNPSTSYGPRKR